MKENSKQNVIDFLNRCVVYADDSIIRKKKRGENKDEILRWQAYRDFTAYASEEVSSGDLDDWFENNEDTEKTSLKEGAEYIELNDLEHHERRRWLSAIISPTPLILVSTISSEGVPNLAPMSSISVISNSPPLIGMSLSKNRDGRPRDTLLNLKETGRATLAILPSNADSAKIIEQTAAPLPRNQSEWKEIDAATSNSNQPSAPNPAIAALETTLIECHQLPLGAVAEWVILKVESIIIPPKCQINDIESSSILCQISDHVVGGTHTTNWIQEIQKKSY